MGSKKKPSHHFQNPVENAPTLHSSHHGSYTMVTNTHHRNN